jgi:transcriptional regulator with XRE-family HTH domain
MGMEQRLGIALKKAVARKSEEIGRDYTSYKLAQDSGTTQSYAYRAINGKIIPGREILTKWCAALGCSAEERAEIFHAAGYLSPEEVEKMLEDETSAAVA